MPKVAGKKFPYTKAGVKAAKKAAVKKGVAVSYGRNHEKIESAAERRREYGPKKMR